MKVAGNDSGAGQADNSQGKTRHSFDKSLAGVDYCFEKAVHDVPSFIRVLIFL